MLNAYAMWDPSSEATDLHVKVKYMFFTCEGEKHVFYLHM
jgi:hypothetical protein